MMGVSSKLMKLFIPRLGALFRGAQDWFDRRERAQLDSVTPAKLSPEEFLDPEKLVPPTDEEQPACKKSRDAVSELPCHGSVTLGFPGTCSDDVRVGIGFLRLSFGYVANSIRKPPPLLLLSVNASFKLLIRFPKPGMAIVSASREGDGIHILLIVMSNQN